MARNTQLIRVLQLAERLRGRRWSIDQLAQEAGVTTRTVRRDLDALSSAGIPVQQATDERFAPASPCWFIARD